MCVCVCVTETDVLNYQYTGAHGCASEAGGNGVCYPDKPDEPEMGRDLAWGSMFISPKKPGLAIPACSFYQPWDIGPLFPMPDAHPSLYYMKRTTPPQDITLANLVAAFAFSWSQRVWPWKTHSTCSCRSFPCSCWGCWHTYRHWTSPAPWLVSSGGSRSWRWLQPWPPLPRLHWRVRHTGFVCWPRTPQPACCLARPQYRGRCQVPWPTAPTASRLGSPGGTGGMFAPEPQVGMQQFSSSDFVRWNLPLLIFWCFSISPNFWQGKVCRQR